MRVTVPQSLVASFAVGGLASAATRSFFLSYSGILAWMTGKPVSRPVKIFGIILAAVTGLFVHAAFTMLFFPGISFGGILLTFTIPSLAVLAMTVASLYGEGEKPAS